MLLYVAFEVYLREMQTCFQTKFHSLNARVIISQWRKKDLQLGFGHFAFLVKKSNQSLGSGQRVFGTWGEW